MSEPPRDVPEHRHEIDRQIDALDRRLDYFSEQVATLEEPAASLLAAAIEELSAAIEELEVATEEVHAQNEALAAAQQQLAEVAAHHRELFVLAPDGYLVTDGNGIISEANQAATRLLGEEEPRLAGKPLVIFVDLPDRQRVLDSLRDAIARAGVVVDLEVRLLPSPGEPLPASIRLVAADSGSDQADRSVHWLMRDVTERVRTGQALLASEARYRLIADNAADVILAADRADLVTYVSPSARTVLGWEPELLEGRSILEGVHPDDRAAFLPLRDGAVFGGHAATITLRVRRGNGGHLPMEAHIGPLIDAAGAVVGIQMALRDVAEREAARIALQGTLAREREFTASLQESEAAKDTLLLAVAHDLRTPVAAAAGLAEILLERYLRLSVDEVRRIAEGLASTTGQLRAILENLLDVERVVGGHITVARERVDLATVVAAVAAEQGLAPATIVLPGASVFVEADAGLTKRIVDNLVSNAVRHAPSGTAVRVGIEEQSEGILLSVEDDGPGVPDELKETIFEAFQRQSGAATGGLGLGLYLVRRFAELQGGVAWVEDGPHGGATFHVRFARPSSS